MKDYLKPGFDIQEFEVEDIMLDSSGEEDLTT